MFNTSWVKGFGATITVCDTQGIIIEMNDRSAEMFAKSGGRELIGKNVKDCHSEASRDKISDMLVNQRANCYTTEKDGVKQFIYQAPWYKDGKFMGLVELVMEIPFDLPHFIRK